MRILAYRKCSSKHTETGRREQYQVNLRCQIIYRAYTHPL